MRENEDQNNSEYGHFLRSECPNRTLWYSIKYFPILCYFYGTFSSTSNFMYQKNMLREADEIISESDIVLK